jgi:hypothetical protein
MNFKPWHKVIDPREDLRENKPRDAAEFAVHLDQVRDELAPDDYKIPQIFFERTYLTENLTQLASEVILRLSGQVHGANAVFNLTTQFGGGKTHALTLLYHLARHGPEAAQWFGVDRLLKATGLKTVPKAAVAVFVGTEFDALRGRGGNDGTPLRRTPWGEIAYQLRDKEGLNLLAEHERLLTAPAGDVIRALLPADQPCLILMDELISYMSRNRKHGWADQLYNFVQSFSEVARGRENVVLVVSLPKAANEMTSEDESDHQRFVKLLGRVSKPVAIASETEVPEIIRRRLFEWDRSAIDQDGKMILNPDAKAVCSVYAQWAAQHRSLLSPEFPFDNAQEEFEATYPFHPVVISLFQRKWRSLPQFQQTRGILKLIAQWVAESYTRSYTKPHPDLLISLGTAPLEVSSFLEDLVSQQLNEQRLRGVIATDICGREDAHADYLDRQAEDEVKKKKLHRKIAVAIFFESNGGQTDARASLPEIRLAVGEPDLDIAKVELVLERLVDTCYYLAAQGQKYSFSVRPNLNKLLADRRTGIPIHEVEDCVRDEVRKIFAKGPLGRSYFPTVDRSVPDNPLITLVVVAPEQAYQNTEVQEQIKAMTNKHGESYRTFKNALIWCVADSAYTTTLYTEARKLLALQAIERDEDAGFDETQRKQIAEARRRAERDMKEAIWRSYHYLVLLNKDNELRTIDLGLLHSSAAGAPATFILRELQNTGEIVESIGINYLLRNWPVFSEWSTKAVRETVFASPKFPRLLYPDSLRATIAQGVTNGQIAYVGKDGSTYDPFFYSAELQPNDVEFSDEMFIITRETAESYITARTASLVEVAIGLPDGTDGLTGIMREETGSQARVARGGIATFAPTQESALSTQAPAIESVPEEPVYQLAWSGEISPLKWMNFYHKVLTGFIIGSSVKLTTQMEILNNVGISRQKIDEIRMALRELGLNEDLIME